jgi:hypothetical protein
MPVDPKPQPVLPITGGPDRPAHPGGQQGGPDAGVGSGGITSTPPPYQEFVPPPDDLPIGDPPPDPPDPLGGTSDPDGLDGGGGSGDGIDDRPGLQPD